MRKLVISPRYDALIYEFEHRATIVLESGGVVEASKMRLIHESGDEERFVLLKNRSDLYKIQGIVYDSFEQVLPLPESMLKEIRPWICPGRSRVA